MFTFSGSPLIGHVTHESKPLMCPTTCNSFHKFKEKTFSEKLKQMHYTHNPKKNITKSKKIMYIFKLQEIVICPQSIAPQPSLWP